MIEGNLHEVDWCHVLACDEVVIGGRIGQGARDIRCGADIVDDDDFLDARQLLEDGSDLGGERDGLAVVEIAVAGDENPRLDLPETVENTAFAEIGGTGRPDAAERGYGE